MARKFGNHLFRNRQALAAGHVRISTSDLPETFGALDEQVIILGKEDIRVDGPSAPLLDWSTFEKGIAVQHLKQDAGCHRQDARPRTALTLEANLVADCVPESAAVFVRHVPGSGARGQTPRF